MVDNFGSQFESAQFVLVLVPPCLVVQLVVIASPQLIVTLSKKYIFEIKIFSKMNDQTDLPDVVLKNDSDLNTFDIIEGLQSISNFFTNIK